jgi:DNA repair exonuclease SbcCD ATPase subunit
VQTGAEVHAHVAALKRDRALMKNNLDALASSIRTRTSEVSSLDEKLRDSQRTLTTVTDAIGTVREQLANRAAELSAAERELDRVDEWKRELAQLQSEIDKWISDVKLLGDLDSGHTDIEKRRATLRDALAKYLIELGHSSVTESNVGTLRLDEQYTPFLGSRRMLALGSASDQSRLVAAFSLALAEASVQLGGFHPGIVLLDEPLQQNPDNPHRDLLFTALSNQLSRNTGFQTVIFTWLPDSDVARLRTAGIPVLEAEGSHFLRLLSPAANRSLEQKEGAASEEPVSGETPESGDSPELEAGHGESSAAEEPSQEEPEAPESA